MSVPRPIHAAVAAMEFNGVPVNLERLNQLRRIDADQGPPIARIDTDYQGSRSHFKLERFQRFLVRNNLPGLF
jgi:hypothetical protein